MGNFFLAPILAFFSKRLYRNVLTFGFGKGFLYLLYLTSLITVLSAFLARSFLVPVMSTYAQWLIYVTPETTLTPDGLEADVEQPYVVRHDDWGPLYTLDTTKALPELLEDMGETPVVIGREHLIYKDPGTGQTRIHDFQQVMAHLAEEQSEFRITKEVMRRMYRQFEKLVVPIVVMMTSIMFFIWKMISVFFYSLIALLLNQLRKGKYTYRSLFALCCYAISPVAVLQVATIAIPNFYLNLNMLIGFLLTVFYVAYAMFAADGTSGKSTAHS